MIKNYPTRIVGEADDISTVCQQIHTAVPAGRNRGRAIGMGRRRIEIARSKT